jgi:hypothetical protein
MKKEAGKKELNILLQTGPLTPPDSLVQDLETIKDMSIDARRLGASFRGGGVGAFITVNTANIDALADILYRHTKRLKVRGADDLAILVGGKINTDDEVVGFRNVQCQRQASLKGKSQDEIKEILEQGG